MFTVDIDALCIFFWNLGCSKGVIKTSNMKRNEIDFYDATHVS